jgi:hypothetical protein
VPFGKAIGNTNQFDLRASFQDQQNCKIHTHIFNAELKPPIRPEPGMMAIR